MLRVALPWCRFVLVPPSEVWKGLPCRRAALRSREGLQGVWNLGSQGATASSGSFLASKLEAAGFLRPPSFCACLRERALRGRLPSFGPLPSRLGPALERHRRGPARAASMLHLSAPPSHQRVHWARCGARFARAFGSHWHEAPERSRMAVLRKQSVGRHCAGAARLETVAKRCAAKTTRTESCEGHLNRVLTAAKTREICLKRSLCEICE